MNERIRELAEQATERFGVKIWDESAGVFYTETHLKLNQEKFAELIVRECVRYFNEDYVRDFDVLWREDLSKGMKEHFGVEV
jgi:hypothetical protein